MTTDVVITLITLLGSAFGTICGIIVSAKLTNYRLCQLEEKVNKHNSVIERTYVLEEKIAVANHRIDDLEERTR